MIDTALGNWLAGVIDGEGCFVITTGVIGPPPDRLVYYTPKFRMALRDDDAPILQEIADRLAIGKIYFCGAPRRGNGKPSVCWDVSRKAACRALVRFLDRFPLRAKKARDFAIWREAVLYWHGVGPGGPRRRPHNHQRMLCYKNDLQQCRLYRPRSAAAADKLAAGPTRRKAA
jgi:hypothetical protein